MKILTIAENVSKNVSQVGCTIFDHIVLLLSLSLCTFFLKVII